LEEALDDLRRSYGLITRYAPKAKIAQDYYDELLTIEGIKPEDCVHNLICLIFVYLVEENSDRVNLLYKETKTYIDLKKTEFSERHRNVLENVMCIGERHERRNNRGKVVTNTETNSTDIASVSVSNNTTSTSVEQNTTKITVVQIDSSKSKADIKTGDLKGKAEIKRQDQSWTKFVQSFLNFKYSKLFVDHSKERLRRKNIRIHDVIGCMKKGVRRIREGGPVKAAAENLIVFFKITKLSLKRPFLFCAYRYISKEELRGLISRDRKNQFLYYIDAIMTSGLYGNYKVCKEQLQDLRRYCKGENALSYLDIEELRDLYSILISIAAPTFEDVYELLNDVFYWKLELNYEFMGLY
jgi:hypothetical protein